MSGGKAWCQWRAELHIPSLCCPVQTSLLSTIHVPESAELALL